MKYKQKIYFIILVSILLAIISLYNINKSHYNSYKHTIMLYGDNADKVIEKGTDIKHYTSHIKRKLEKSGLKNVVVEVNGENLYGMENTIFIEAIPPSTKLDKLINRSIEPIRIKQTFINKS